MPKKKRCASPVCPFEDCDERSFHSFPDKTSERQAWLRALGLTHLENEDARVCSQHFQEDDFYQGSKRTVTGDRQRHRLKDKAVPTLSRYLLRSVSRESSWDLRRRNARGEGGSSTPLFFIDINQTLYSQNFRVIMKNDFNVSQFHLIEHPFITYSN